MRSTFLVVTFMLLIVSCSGEGQNTSPGGTDGGGDHLVLSDTPSQDVPVTPGTDLTGPDPDEWTLPDPGGWKADGEELGEDGTLRPPWTDNAPEKVAEVEDDGTRIKDLQQSSDSLECQVLYGSMLVGIDIKLSKVTVTSPAYHYQFVGEKLDGFYVADPEGGPYSGIHATYATNSLPKLKPGMTVTLVGDHKEAFCFSIFNAKSILIESEDEAPLPYMTTPEEILGDPESFEGVLVRLDKVEVTSANPDAAEGLDKHEFEVAGQLRIGNDFELKYMTAGTDARKEGDVFEYVVGVLKFVDERYVVMPRFEADMLFEGETPPVESPVETVELAEVLEEVVVQPESVEPMPDVTEPPDTWEIIEEVAPETGGEDDLPVEDLTPEIPAQPDSPVVITEIMYDPVEVPDDKGEWFELVNASDEAVDIDGWRLEDQNGQMHVIVNGGPYMMQPGDILVFGANAMESTNGGVEIDYQYPYADFALANTEDSIVLKNIYGEVVDEVKYNENSGWPVGKGKSLELFHPNLDNSLDKFWSVATVPYGDESNLGTPGELP